MTKEIIRQIENDYWKEKANPIDMAEVFDLAAKALEQQPSEDCISRDEAINVVHKYFVKYLKINDDICLDGIRSLPSVTPKFTDAEIQKMQELEQAQLEKVYELGKTEIQPCEDCISRNDAIELIAGVDETNGNEPVFSGKQVIEMFKGLPSATPSYNSVKTELKPCEDCISREDAIKETKALFLRNFDSEYVVEMLKTLPSVTPKTRWIPISESLPDTRGYYLTTVKIAIHDLNKLYYEIRAAQFDGKDFDCGYIGDGFRVIAWMPLPQPYAESRDDEDERLHYE